MHSLARFMTAVRLVRVRNVRGAQRGFTLIELMIVMSLIALIAGSIGVALYKKWEDSREKAAQLQVREVLSQVAQYLLTKSRCPTVDDLVTEHYVRREPKDPWGTPLIIRCPGEHGADPADVLSAGKDRTAETPDDIRSWDL